MLEHISFVALAAGGCAGLSVDVALFPLDTIKTRYQSKEGFIRSGGFRGVYAGLPSAAIGSVPGAALFFCTYESMKQTLSPHVSQSQLPLVHMAAASAGEVMACLVRVPTEVIKQRAQAKLYPTTREVFAATLKNEGFRGFYRGYLSTVIREIPFSFIQFPLWELLKSRWSAYQGSPVAAWQSALTGAISGGFAAALTTPLDVAKTRIMLAKAGSVESQGSIRKTLQIVHAESGVKGLFAGCVPRVLWISIGGAIFLGIYDAVRLFITKDKERR